MNWDLFGWFATVSLCLWGFGALTAWKGKSMGWVLGPTLAGLLVFFTFILGMWISLERPPMRGGDPFVVFLFLTIGRYHHLCSLAL